MASRTRGRDMSMKGLKSLSVVALLSVVAAPMPAFAKSAQKIRDEKSAEIPVCSKKLGTLSVVEPESDWWREQGLGSPEALIKVFVRKSSCFTLVDRGKGRPRHTVLLERFRQRRRLRLLGHRDRPGHHAGVPAGVHGSGRSAGWPAR